MQDFQKQCYEKLELNIKYNYLNYAKYKYYNIKLINNKI